MIKLTCLFFACSILKEFSSSYVYFGNYAVDDTADVVTHYRISSSIPAVWGTTVKRKFSFKDDTMILEPLNAKQEIKVVKTKINTQFIL